MTTRPQHTENGASTAATATRAEADPFVAYYSEASASAETRARFVAIRDAVMRMLRREGLPTTALDVGDVGCGAATQALLWASDGHRVRGIDINSGLLDVARQRIAASGAEVELAQGSAEALPWPAASLDVCLVPELLEHVPDAERVLDECMRVLRPGGVLYLSTTNWLCPKQQEFDLPMYSWYPPALKRHFERVCVTTRPELVNHASYPAVHWFSYFGLRRALRRRGLATAYDRFDIADLDSKGVVSRAVFQAVRHVMPLRLLAHVGTPYTVLIGFKRRATD